MNNYEWSTAYTDLLNEIDILNARLYDLSRDLRGAENAYETGGTKLTASYSGMPSGSGINVQAMAQADRIEYQISEVKVVLARKKETKRIMESYMSEMRDPRRMLIYKRDIEHKKLSVIAKEIGYSHQWTKELSAKIKRLQAG